MSLEINQTEINLCNKLIDERRPKWEELFKALKELSESYKEGELEDGKWIRNDRYEPYLGYSWNDDVEFYDYDSVRRVSEIKTYFDYAMEYASKAFQNEMDHLHEPILRAKIIREIEEKLEKEKTKKKKSRKKSS